MTTWNEVYEAIGLYTEDTVDHESIRRLLEKSEIITGDCVVGGIQDFYVLSDTDEHAYELVDNINFLCGVYEVPASFYIAAKHI